MAAIDLSLLPAVLRGLRLRNGKTQVEVAAQAGVPQANLSRWESGKVRPSLESLVAVLTALGIDFRDLQDALEEASGEGGASAVHGRARLAGPSAESARVLAIIEQLDRRVTRIETVMALDGEAGTSAGGEVDVGSGDKAGAGSGVETGGEADAASDPAGGSGFGPPR